MIFNLLYLIALVLLSPYLVLRSFRTGRYRANLGDKLWGTKISLPKSSQKRVWLHGVSVGEIHLLRILVNALRKELPDVQLVISSTTDTGLAEAKKIFADLTVIVFPFDFSWAVRNTFNSIQPDLIVLAESELWPNFLRIAAQKKIPVLVANGRMSPRSAKRYQKIARLARVALFQHVTRFAMQSSTYANGLISLGIPSSKVGITGNIKYDGVALDKGNPKTQTLRNELGLNENPLIWVAGSTHAPEEEICLDVFARLKTRFPELKLILVPRAQDRFDEVAGLIQKTGIPFIRRSRQESHPCEIILIDTIGELAAVWGLASVGFTGGSLNQTRGGQSMIEPAGYGVPVIFGPYTFNFKDAVAGLLEANGAKVIRTPDEMEVVLIEWLSSEGLRNTIGGNAKRFILAQQGATTNTINEIRGLLAISSGTSQP